MYWAYQCAHSFQVDSIRLFPNAARGGEFWWPDSYKPSIVLTRRGAKRQEPGAEIVITESIATTGYPKREFSTDHIAADVYYASVKQGDTLTPGLVLKFIDKDSRLVSAAFVDDFVLEAEHHNTAKDVQGSALPHFAGLFRSGSLYCLVFEDAGRDLTDEEYASKAVRYGKHTEVLKFSSSQRRSRASPEEHPDDRRQSAHRRAVGAARPRR